MPLKVDRKYNSIGYTKNNCVPCCEECNRFKMSMDINDFITKIEEIFKCTKRLYAD